MQILCAHHQKAKHQKKKKKNNLTTASEKLTKTATKKNKNKNKKIKALNAKHAELFLFLFVFFFFWRAEGCVVFSLVYGDIIKIYTTNSPHLQRISENNNTFFVGSWSTVSTYVMDDRH